MPSRTTATGADKGPKVPAKGKARAEGTGTPAPAAPGKPKAGAKAQATTAAATAATTKPGPASKAKAPAAPPPAGPSPAFVAAKLAEMLGDLVDRPSLELLGVLHGEPLTGAQVAERYEIRPVNPIDPLRKHKLVAGDKARRFAPTARGKLVWTWAVRQAGG